jgi:lipopolysaccharide transport system permease protein
MSIALEVPPTAGANTATQRRPRSVPGREVLITPSRGGMRLGLGDFWAYRSLLYFLVWRDLKVRYAETVLGVAWTVVQPLLNTVVLTLVFGRLVHVPTDGVPYALFALAAIIPWTFVSAAVGASGQSVLNSANLITKVYFPRLVIPWAAVASAALDFVIGLVVLGGALVVYRRIPEVSAVIVVPASILAFALTAAGIGCWTSALSLKYRDVKHLVPFFTTLWMYVSPVVYPMSRIPDRYRWAYALNPLAGTLEGFRAALVGRPVAWGAWAESATAAVLLFLAGTLYFQRTERVFADIM